MFNEPALDYLPKAYRGEDYGIGLIGAGGIAEIGHIPAFVKAEYRIAAVADVSETRRQYCRDVIGLSNDRLFSDYRKLLELDIVDIVDVCLPHRLPQKMTVLHDAIDAGKHILVEKPISMDYKESREVVMHAQRAGVKMAVCHQYRWMPVFRSVKNLIDQGYLGKLFFITFDERWAYDFPGLSYSEHDNVLFFIESIHFIDEFRWWAGREPVNVFASVSRRPDQNIKGDTVGTLVLDFGEGLKVTYNGNIASFPQAQGLSFRLEGTKGLINGYLSDLWSAGGFEYSPAVSEAFWYKPALEGQGFPDGYIGLMGDLMEAIAENREPVVSGQDNLKTLQIVHAAYLSDQLGRFVSPSEIESGATN